MHVKNTHLLIYNFDQYLGDNGNDDDDAVVAVASRVEPFECKENPFSIKRGMNECKVNV